MPPIPPPPTGPLSRLHLTQVGDALLHGDLRAGRYSKTSCFRIQEIARSGAASVYDPCRGQGGACLAQLPPHQGLPSDSSGSVYFDFLICEMGPSVTDCRRLLTGPDKNRQTTMWSVSYHRHIRVGAKGSDNHCSYREYRERAQSQPRNLSAKEM